MANDFAVTSQNALGVHTNNSARSKATTDAPRALPETNNANSPIPTPEETCTNTVCPRLISKRPILIRKNRLSFVSPSVIILVPLATLS